MASAGPKIGIIICSSRTPRACPQIANFVIETIKLDNLPTPPNLQPPSLTVIDLQERNLPMFNESAVPSQIHSYTEYDHAHTQSWSQEIQRYNAFIFVTPQYNWGYPAVVKNAIDYLFHEWKGKAAMIVSYGGHGGGKANAQLKQVLQGVRMRPIEKTVELAFPTKDLLVKASSGEDLELISGSGTWSAQGGSIIEAYKELLEAVSADVVSLLNLN
jgi:NAD(P)H-dependent FMN reductase